MERHSDCNGECGGGGGGDPNLYRDMHTNNTTSCGLKLLCTFKSMLYLAGKKNDWLTGPRFSYTTVLQGKLNMCLTTHSLQHIQLEDHLTCQ
ncbi:hypothetical protein E1A91_D09G222400v1 [Gossypium mustelinum]|uniref:Uncharacterized protein n=1 Tax=Gossypium mustelinum TaxID=34275 RepID=A0A5D2TMT6_GOSMU|nr:hypothetical protein E1A91_D09G222400v1 [Gossypium mustelinum]